MNNEFYEFYKKLGRYPKVIKSRDCFIHNGGYFAATIKVLEGGFVDYWGVKTREEFIKDVESGWVTVDIPDGETLRICNQDLVVRVEETRWQYDRPDDNIKIGDLMFRHKWVTKESFKMEILDAIDTAKGNKPASQLCYEAFINYENNPNAETQRKLKKAYEDVPEHNRIFILGDQDLKDKPLLWALAKDHKRDSNV